MWKAALVFAVVLLVGTPVVGDTLELKDGRLLTGMYVGGTQNTVRFKVKDQTMVVSAADVLALTFDRKAAPAPTPVAVPTQGGVTVLAGTALLIRTNELIDSSRHGTGYRFTGSLEFDLVVGGRVVAKKGSLVYGILTKAKKGGRLARKAELHLALTDIAIKNQRQPIQTGGFALKGEKQRTLRKVAVGAGVGRLLGGKRKGARRGAAVGLAAAALSSKQIKVPPKTLLEFQLKAPFTVK